MNFKTIYNILDEMAQAKKGNWKGSDNMLGQISKLVIDNYYTKIDTININSSKYILYKNNQEKKKDNYVLGSFIDNQVITKNGAEDKTVFDIIFGITFSKYNNTKTYGTIYNVDGVAVSTFGKGISSKMYKYFVQNMKLIIIGDSEQYFGARKLWSSLSKEIDVEVDIYNLEEDEIIEKNVILHHGNYSNDFDERLWSYSKDKHHIRSILKDIK